MPSIIIAGTCAECMHWRELPAAHAQHLGDGLCTLMAGVGGLPNYATTKAMAFRPVKTGDNAGLPDDRADCEVATDRDFGCTMFAFPPTPRDGMARLAEAVDRLPGKVDPPATAPDHPSSPPAGPVRP